MKPKASWNGWPWLAFGVCLFPLLTALRPIKAKEGFDLATFARLPVLHGGRVKPMDTLARTSLLMLRGKQSIRFEEQKISALEWLLEMAYRPSAADRLPSFEINDPDVLGLIGFEPGQRRHYSFEELQPHLPSIEVQSQQADAVAAPQRSRYQSAILGLRDRIILYQKLQNTLQLSGEDRVAAEYRTFMEKLAPAMFSHMVQRKRSARGVMEETGRAAARYDFMDQIAEFRPLPGARGLAEGDWHTMGKGITDVMTQPEVHPGILAYAEAGDAWRARNAAAFNTAVQHYDRWLADHYVEAQRQGRYEAIFNRISPFMQSMVLYILVFLLATLSWIAAPQALNRAAWAVLVLAFMVHTIGLVSRMILQGRPPVTNLYSSAVFVGWAAVLLGMVLERLHRNGIGSVAASMIGFVTLIIAHHLTTQGDTLEMMRAVLDSNFWLATHVVTITIGYSSTFLSGFLAILYLVRRAVDRRWSEGAAVSLEKMVYGVVCFSLLLSFVGTILGGIWADQSWGRFWGWDPKENGALMIVLWNAVILHARVGGFCDSLGVMGMAIFGNIVTAFSWFGVNMLGIGLHSYGFMDKAFLWLMLFSLVQVALMALAWIPDTACRSRKH